MAIPNNITINGTNYIKYIDDIDTPKLGDTLLLLNDDAISPKPGNYYNINTSGYVKAKVFDGKFWQNIDISDFCEDGEHKISKKQRPIDVIELCKSKMMGSRGIIIYRTYRGHFTINQYLPSIYDRGKFSEKKK